MLPSCAIANISPDLSIATRLPPDARQDISIQALTRTEAYQSPI
jgi:hypothetical protein